MTSVGAMHARWGLADPVKQNEPAHLRGADTRGQGSRRSPRRPSRGARSAQTRSGGWRRRPKGGRGAASSGPRRRVHSCSMPTEPRATEPKRSRAARAAHGRTRLTAAGVERSTPRGARIGPDRHREAPPPKIKARTSPQPTQHPRQEFYRYMYMYKTRAAEA